MSEQGQQKNHTEIDQTEDSRVFGADVWVYCDQHLRPHRTGWCTVPPRNKIALEAKTIEAAYAECCDRGLKLYGDRRPN